MQTRRLGRSGPSVSAIGLGCMGMSEFYGPGDENESIATIHHALANGVTMLDTADMYGPYTNEELVGRALRGHRDEAFVATKFGFVRDPVDPTKRELDGSPKHVRESCDGSLRRLGVDVIDLYYLHRVDAKVPVTETVGAMSRLVEVGKVRYIGLSEVSAATLTQAHAVHPITAVQSEYSLWTREPEDEVLAACDALGVGFVPYSPLGRGFLTGAIRSVDDFAPDDYRRQHPRFQGENFAKNLQLVERVNAFAQDKGCTPSQLALAWVLAQGDTIVPIPGTKRRKYLDENIGAVGVILDARELAALDEVMPRGAVTGARYPERMMQLTGR
jgi:aryl-alcohol dehydrogenase-like predicted oxidoreductase